MELEISKKNFGGAADSRSLLAWGIPPPPQFLRFFNISLIGKK